MSWPATSEAEIARRLHQAHTDVMVPQPIDEHAASQRIRRADDPFGQRPATLSFASIDVQLARQARQTTQGTGRHGFSRLFGIAAMQQLHDG